jgi:Putative sensor
MTTAARPRLTLRRDPLRLVVSGSLWRGAGFLASYVLAAGWLMFAAGLAAVVTALMTAVFIFGIPLLSAAAWVLRGCANAERVRAGRLTGEPVRGRYRPVTRRGLAARASTRWTDPATWRDLACVVALWVPLFALDVTVLAIWLSLLCLIFLPAWYWAPRSTFGHGHVVHGVQLGYFPDGPRSVSHWGWYVTTPHQAVVAGAVCLVLFLLFNYVVVAAARLHAAVTRVLLRAPGDPLAPARAVLDRPGPIPPHALVDPDI